MFSEVTHRIGYLSIYEVNNIVTAQKMFDCVRDITSRALDRFECVHVTDIGAFYNELFEMLVSISQGMSFQAILSDYETPMCETDLFFDLTYDFPGLLFHGEDENEEDAFISQLYHALSEDYRAKFDGITYHFVSVLRELYGAGGFKTIAYIIDGCGCLCMKYRIMKPFI